MILVVTGSPEAGVSDLVTRASEYGGLKVARSLAEIPDGPFDVILQLAIDDALHLQEIGAVPVRKFFVLPKNPAERRRYMHEAQRCDAWFPNDDHAANALTSVIAFTRRRLTVPPWCRSHQVFDA